MQRAHVFEFCELGGNLWRLETIASESTVSHHGLNILRAQHSLGRVLDDALIPVIISRNNISRLLRVSDGHVPDNVDEIDFGHKFTRDEANDIKTRASQVKTVLNAEYANVDTY